MTYKFKSCRICGTPLGIVAHTHMFCDECAKVRNNISKRESKMRKRESIRNGTVRILM